jgi:rfaE bifunctional protein nucleotidyltransferase chain/domain/rfaE bifunctional protein kinase chain/domain
MNRTLVVVGDALLDRDLDGRVERVCPDAPVPVVSEVRERARPGGAALAATIAAGEIEGEVVLVTAIADDPAGAELRAALDEAAVRVVDLGLSGATVEKIRIRADGQSLVRVDRGDGPAEVGPWADPAASALAAASTVLVSDYGRGLTARPDVRTALTERHGSAHLVWDPHPRGAEPVGGCRLVTPNAAEARGATPDRAHALRARWAAHAVAVTMGRDGALLVEGEGTALRVPAPAASGWDPCGAGDCFASAAAAALASGAVVSEAVETAVARASAFVAGGGAAGFASRRSPGQPSTGARGGTLVATGGCFDLLHAGHVAMLQAARSLGDRLVVLLNSDRSVQRLKGPARPRQTEQDRAAVLRALGCVDEVVVFDEDTPVAALRELRPDIFVKGGDYALGDLPEAAAMQHWGGQTVVVPYLPGRSTTRLLEGTSPRAR